MLEAMSLAQNYTKCPNMWHHNCVSTLRKFNCCCFVFVLSTLRWHGSPVRVTWNRTETFWSLPTSDGTQGSCRKHEHLPRPNSKVAKMFHKCCQIVADLSQDTAVLVCFSFVSLVWTRPSIREQRRSQHRLDITFVTTVCLQTSLFLITRNHLQNKTEKTCKYSPGFPASLIMTAVDGRFISYRGRYCRFCREGNVQTLWSETNKYKRIHEEITSRLNWGNILLPIWSENFCYSKIWRIKYSEL
jgi:hypothetical protein